MNNNNSFSNASSNIKPNENLSNFIGYNNYYEGLRQAKRRGQYQENINVAPLKEFWNQDSFYLEHIKPELEMMENNIPTRKGANTMSAKPHTKRNMFQRALAATNKGEYKRLTNAYKELENPPPFVEFFLSERLKKKVGGKRRTSKAPKTRKARRSHKKRCTSRR